MNTRPLTPEELKSIEPKVLPVDDEAAKLGLPPGMHIDGMEDYRKGWNSDWRCSCCHKMQTDPRMVYISDSIEMGDSLYDIDGKMKRGWYSGGGSGWCIPCVQRLVREPLWRRIKRWLS